MNDWEIVSIREDLESTDCERWLILYKVPIEYAPDGFFSYSLPKDVLNAYAAAYEYDIDDEQDREDLFDHVMSVPMLNNAIPRANDALRATDASDRSAAPVSAAMLNPFEHPAEELKAKMKAQVGELKEGLAQLKAASNVSLEITGMAAKADPGENPKYIIKRDMMGRLNPDRIAADRQRIRSDRLEVMQAKREKEEGRSRS